MSALKDQNRVPVWFGVSSVDGISPTLININSSTGRVLMEIGTSVSASINAATKRAIRDQNFLPVHGGVSTADSSVWLPLSVNPATGAILAQTT